MTTNRNLLRSGAVAIAVGSVLIATPTAAGAGNLSYWGPCLAADDVPICDLVTRVERSGSAGTDVALRPVPTEGTGTISDCFPAGRSPSAGDVARCAR